MFSNILWCFETNTTGAKSNSDMVKTKASASKSNHVLLLYVLKLEAVSDAFNYSPDVLVAERFI